MDRAGDRYARAATRGMRWGVAALLLFGLYARNVSVALNAALALGVTLLPAALRRDWDVRLGAGSTLWIAAAVFLHTVGMVGAYTAVGWWDHLTHTLSATIVAGVGYATVRAFDEYSDAVSFPPRFVSVYVLLFTLALGVLWEVLEFAARAASDALGIDAVLVQYGVGDTVLDLVFDAVGASMVALFGTGPLSGLVESIRIRLDRTGG